MVSWNELNVACGCGERKVTRWIVDSGAHIYNYILGSYFKICTGMSVTADHFERSRMLLDAF